jgi:hypothetical protein
MQKERRQCADFIQVGNVFLVINFVGLFALCLWNLGIGFIMFITCNFGGVFVIFVPDHLM